MNISDETTATAQNALAALTAPIDVFGLVQALLLAAANPKACQIAAAELKRQADQVTADRAALEADRAAFAKHESETRAALAKQAAQNSDEAAALHNEKLRVDDRHRGLSEMIREIETREGHLKRRLLREAGLLVHFNDQLQSLPSWDELDRAIRPGDPHFASMPDDEPQSAEQTGKQHDPHADVSGSPFPAHATLTRALPRQRARAPRHDS
jgi:hypothetical protein